ncbi:hypothetical protein lerEdw1_010589 [Lerista edwardsae]|nr:hypothetical protein lerEdw1_010589 [Lerista edwardsae]
MQPGPPGLVRMAVLCLGSSSERSRAGVVALHLAGDLAVLQSSGSLKMGLACMSSQPERHSACRQGNLRGFVAGPLQDLKATESLAGHTRESDCDKAPYWTQVCGLERPGQTRPQLPLEEDQLVAAPEREAVSIYHFQRKIAPSCIDESHTLPALGASGAGKKNSGRAWPHGHCQQLCGLNW